MKKFLLIGLMILTASLAIGQSNPGALSIDAPISGSQILLNANWTTQPTMSRDIFLVSTEGRFYASFWRWDAGSGTWKRVSLNNTADGDTVVSVPMNLIYPVTIKCDLISLKGYNNTVLVDAYWYE